MLGNNQFGIYNFDKVKNSIEENSKLIVLKSEYVNQSTSLNIQCECGEEFKASYRKLRENKFRTKCKKCRVANTGETNFRNNKNKFYKYMESIKDYEIIEYKDVRERSIFHHSKCNNNFLMRTDVFKRGSRCHCESSSKGEREIINILECNDVDYIKEFSFKDCRSEKNFPLRFDFALFKKTELILLIEFNGIQHYQEDNWLNNKNGINDRLKNDNIKINYCKKNNIPLLIIPYSEIEKTESLIFNMIISSQATESHKSM